MSDLQADIDKWDALKPGDTYDTELVVRIVEAARQHANPDIPAAAEAIMICDKNVPYWSDATAEMQKWYLETAQSAVDAALSVTEDE